jgi:hypothetical protein
MINDEFNSVTWNWAQTKRWAEAMLDRERKKNDALDLDPVQTAHTRGRISLLKELLSLEIRARARIDQPE